MRVFFKKTLITLILFIFIFNTTNSLAVDYSASSIDSLTSDNETFNIFDCVRISGSAEKGYYYEIKAAYEEKLKNYYSENENVFQQIGLTSSDIFIEFIKAQATSSLPNLGGVVKNLSGEVSNGSESQTTIKSVLQKTDGTSNSESSQDMIWPIGEEQYNKDAQTRGNLIVCGVEKRNLVAYDAQNGGMHKGLDIMVPEGTPIVAALPGTVIKSEFLSDGAGVVAIDCGIVNGNQTFALYAHCSDVSIVNVGDVVEKGKVIAYSGNTGVSLAPHLHFELDKDQLWGDAIDPLELYSSNYVDGDKYKGTGSGNLSVDSSASNAYAKFTTTKDETSAAQHILDNIVVEENVNLTNIRQQYNKYLELYQANETDKTSIIYEQLAKEANKKFNGGVILRRITPNKNFGEDLEEAEISEQKVKFQRQYESRGIAIDLPDAIANKLNISKDIFSLLYIPYRDEEENVQIGMMIVNKKFADEVLDIFNTLYQELYTIENISLPQNLDNVETILPYNSYEEKLIYEVTAIYGQTIPNESDSNYISFMNNKLEEVKVYYETFRETNQIYFSGDILDNNNNFTDEAKQYFGKLKSDYTSFRDKCNSNSDDIISSACNSRKDVFNLRKQQEEEKQNQQHPETVEYCALNNITYGYINDTTNSQVTDLWSTLGQTVTLNPLYNPLMNGDNVAIEGVDPRYAQIENITGLTEKEYAYKLVVDDERITYFEELGWKWQGYEGIKSNNKTGDVSVTQKVNFGKFYREEEAQETQRNDPQKKLLANVYDLSYVDYKTFDSYIQQGDKRILYVYTIGPDGYIYTGTWKYETFEGTQKISYIASEPISFYSSLYKYEMNFEYLTYMISQVNNVAFVKRLASLAQDSVYIMGIEDVVNVKTTTNETRQTTHTVESVQQTQQPICVKNWFTKFIMGISESETDIIYSPIFLTDSLKDEGQDFVIKLNVHLTKVESEENVAKTSSSSTFLEAAKVIWEKMNGEYTYGHTNLTPNITDNPNNKVVDCSTYVTWVFNQCGLDIPHTNSSGFDSLLSQWSKDGKAKEVQNVKTLDDLEGGDIVLYNGHIQIYAGDGAWYNAGGDGPLKNKTADYDVTVNASGTSKLDYDGMPHTVVYRLDADFIKEKKKTSTSANIESTNTTNTTNKKDTNSNNSQFIDKLYWVTDSWGGGSATGVLSNWGINPFIPSGYIQSYGGSSYTWSENSAESIKSKMPEDSSGIVITLGLNGASANNDAMQKTVEELAKLDIPIFLVKCTYVAKYAQLYGGTSPDAFNRDIDKLNDKMKEISDSIDNVNLIDPTGVLLEDGYLNSEMAGSDGYHLKSLEYYKRWCDEIVQKITDGDFGFSEKVKTDIIKYVYSRKESYATGNSNAFKTLYEESNALVKASLNDSNLYKILQSDGRTKQLSNITRYLVNQATNKNYTSTSLRWSEWLPGEYSEKKDEFDSKIDERLLFVCGVIYEGACTGSYDLGDSYGSEVLQDSAGNTTAFGLTKYDKSIAEKYGYDAFSVQIDQGRVNKSVAQNVYVKVMEEAKNALVGEDEQGGAVLNPNGMSQGMLNALLDAYHNKGPAGSSDLVNIYNTKQTISKAEFVSCWGSNLNYQGTLMRRSQARWYIAEQDIFVAYYDGRKIEFNTETPWQDFCEDSIANKAGQTLDLSKYFYYGDVVDGWVQYN